MKTRKIDVEAIKEEIINKAIEVFSQKGYELTNMQDIADSVGISRGPLYYHFRNKLELYNSAIDYYINYTFAKYEAIFQQNVRILKKIEDDLFFCTEQLKYKDMFNGLFLDKKFADIQKKYIEYCNNIYQLKLNNVKQAIAKGEIRKDANPKQIVDLIYVFYEGLNSLYKNKDKMSGIYITADEMESLINLLINNIKTEYIC